MMVLILSLALLLILGYTIYSLTKHDTLYAEAEEMARTMPMNKLVAEDKSLGIPVWTFFIAGALLTGTFAVQFFAGSDDPSSFTTSQMVYAGIGCIMTLAITMAQKSLYSSIHTSKAGLLITFLILLFVIFSEIATSSERTDMLVKHRSENSQVYQGVVGAINAPTAPANINTRGLADAQAAAAKAQVEIEACSRHASKGQARVDKCLRIERGNLAAAEGRIKAIQGQNDSMANSAIQLKLQLVDKAKELQYDEEQNPAIIKFLKALFGGAILYSMIFASLIIVVAFESGFHFTGTRRAVIRHAILLKQGVNDPVAQPAPLPEKQSDLGQWNAELSKSGIDSPDDPIMNQQADQDQIERIIERGQKAGETVPGTVPEGVPGTVNKRVYKLIYTEVRKQVIEGEINPTVRPVTNAVTAVMTELESIINMKPSDLGKPKRQKLAEMILEHLEQENIICRNQEGGIGKPKYVLSDKYRNKIIGTQEEQINLV